MDFKKIVNNIMYECKDTNEVEAYFVSIKEQVSCSTLDGTEYPLFVEYAGIYAKVRERLETYPLVGDVYNGEDGKTYDSEIIGANLEYAASRLAEHLSSYLNKPIIKYNC